MEDDDELEDGGDAEPSLGSVDPVINQERAWSTSEPRLRSLLDAELDTADDEPSLGWHDDHHAFANMATRSPHEDEPTLGSSANLDQHQWNTGEGNDYERS